MKHPIRLLVVDDQAAVRESLAVMLDLDPEIEVAGTAANGCEAISEAERLEPDVVLMDLDMPVMGGVEATSALRRSRPAMPVVVLSTVDDDESVFGALRAGARGYLTKDSERAALVQAVRSAHVGHAVLSLDVQLRLVDLALRGGPVQSAPAPGMTIREREVLELIGRGLRNGEIASELAITQATVKTHINNLFGKAGLRTRAEAVRLAMQLRDDEAASRSST